MTPLVLLAKPLPLSQLITPKQGIQNLNTVDEYIKATVMNVKETKQPQGGLNNEWSSRNSVPEDTNFYRASTEWCEEPYEQSHKC